MGWPEKSEKQSEKRGKKRKMSANFFAKFFCEFFVRVFLQREWQTSPKNGLQHRNPAPHYDSIKSADQVVL